MMVKAYEDDLVIKYEVKSPTIRTTMDALTGAIDSIEFEGRRYVTGQNVSLIEIVSEEQDQELKYGWRAAELKEPRYILSFRKSNG